jgi:leucine-rich repeat protein SHOC2
MRLSASLIMVLALASAGCFPQKAPPRPVTANSLVGLERPATVEFLDLHEVAGAALPPDMAPFESLTQVSLRNTGLTAAPGSLASIRALAWLDLSENQLTAFPDPALIPNVETLYTADNALTELPSTVGNLARLTYLNLDRNQLTALPAEIGNLKELTFLRLNGNKLTSLPESMGQLKNLKRLYLKGNPLPDTEKQKIRALLPAVEIID